VLIQLIMILASLAILLIIPLFAMQFTNEVRLILSDSIILGILLFGTGLLCELVMRKVKSINGRLIILGTILLTQFVVWAELAVGIFVSPFAGCWENKVNFQNTKHS